MTPDNNLYVQFQIPVLERVSYKELENLSRTAMSFDQRFIGSPYQKFFAAYEDSEKKVFSLEEVSEIPESADLVTLMVNIRSRPKENGKVVPGSYFVFENDDAGLGLRGILEGKKLKNMVMNTVNGQYKF